MILTLRLSTGGQVSSAELVMNIWFVRRQLCCQLQICNRVFNLALLQKSFAELVMCIREVRLNLNDFTQQLDSVDGVLLGEHYEAQIIFGLHVAGIQSQLAVKFLRCFSKLSRLQI